jgi:hypothetical protein
LLHDAIHSAVDVRAFDRTSTLQAVDMLLQHFGNIYQFVTVPALLRRGSPQLSNWERPPNLEWLNALHPARDRSTTQTQQSQ